MSDECTIYPGVAMRFAGPTCVINLVEWDLDETLLNRSFWGREMCFAYPGRQVHRPSVLLLVM